VMITCVVVWTAGRSSAAPDRASALIRRNRRDPRPRIERNRARSHVARIGRYAERIISPSTCIDRRFAGSIDPDECSVV
jgi:hypothetical protein